MSDAFSFKRGAELPARVITLSGNGVTTLAAIDAGTLLFVYREKGVETDRRTINAQIVDAAAMKVEVDFSSVDTATLGRYEWEVEGQIAGRKLYWPEKGFYTFSVTDNIDGL